MNSLGQKVLLLNIFLTLLFLSVITANQLSSFTGNINVRALLFFAVSILFFYSFYNSIIKWVFESNHYFRLLFAYFIIHNFIIFYLFQIGYSNYEDSELGFLLNFSRAVNIIFQVFLFIYFFQNFKKENFDFFFMILLSCTLLIFFQYIYFSFPYFLKGTLPNIVFNDFLFHDPLYTSLISLITFAYAFTRYFISMKIIYLLLFLISIIVIFSTYQRSALLAAFIFIILTMITSRLFSLRQLLLIFILLFLSYLFYDLFLSTRENLVSTRSLNDRIVLWANGLNIFYDYFPFGVGANNNENFFALNSQSFVQSIFQFANEIGNEELKKRAFILLNSSIYEGGISTHNSHIDILSDFGLLGLIALSLYHYFPIKIMMRNYGKRSYNAILTRSMAILVLSISVYLLFLSSLQLLWIVFIVYSNMLFLYSRDIKNEK